MVSRYTISPTLRRSQIAERARESARQEAFDLGPIRRVSREWQEAARRGGCTKLPPEGGIGTPYEYVICFKRGSSSFTITAYNRATRESAGYFVVSRKSGRIGRQYSSDLWKVGWAGAEAPWEAFYKAEIARERGKPVAPSGLGTRLYERALRTACQVAGGDGLTSDTTRSVFSEAFWRKQHEKGRAICVGNGSQSSYYSSPLDEAYSFFVNKGRFDLFNKFKRRLPEPEMSEPEYYTVKKFKGYEKVKTGTEEVKVGTDEKGNPIYEEKPVYEEKPKYEEVEKKKDSDEVAWPCDYYAIPCRRFPESLDGLKLRRKASRARKR